MQMVMMINHEKLKYGDQPGMGSPEGTERTGLNGWGLRNQIHQRVYGRHKVSCLGMIVFTVLLF